jgi:hypothetical protein
MQLWTNADFDELRKGLGSEGKQLRHEVRYACFRVQNELQGGAKADEKHHAIAKEIEKLEGFEGWNKFSITWDISTPSPIVIVKRKWSIYQEWNQTLERVLEPLPIASIEEKPRKGSRKK